MGKATGHSKHYYQQISISELSVVIRATQRHLTLSSHSVASVQGSKKVGVRSKSYVSPLKSSYKLSIDLSAISRHLAVIWNRLFNPRFHSLWTSSNIRQPHTWVPIGSSTSRSSELNIAGYFSFLSSDLLTTCQKDYNYHSKIHYFFGRRNQPVPGKKKFPYL